MCGDAHARPVGDICCVSCSAGNYVLNFPVNIAEVTQKMMLGRRINLKSLVCRRVATETNANRTCMRDLIYPVLLWH